MKIKEAIEILMKCDPEKEILGYDEMTYTPYHINSFIKIKDLIKREKVFMAGDADLKTEDEYDQCMLEIDDEFREFDGNDVVFSYERQDHT